MLNRRRAECQGVSFKFIKLQHVQRSLMECLEASKKNMKGVIEVI